MSNADDSNRNPTTEDFAPLVEEGVREAIPGGGFLVKFLQAITQRGEFSFDHRTMPLYIQFIYEDIDEIRKNIERLRALGDRKRPDAADMAATIESIAQASRTTTNYKKRELLRHAAVNAFDPRFYEEGLVRRFLQSIEELEYGDVEMLRKIVEKQSNQNARTVSFDELGVSTVFGKHGGLESIADYHLTRLEEAHMVTGFRNGTCLASDFGKEFLNFVSKSEDSSGLGEEG